MLTHHFEKRLAKREHPIAVFIAIFTGRRSLLHFFHFLHTYAHASSCLLIG